MCLLFFNHSCVHRIDHLAQYLKVKHPKSHIISDHSWHLHPLSNIACLACWIGDGFILLVLFLSCNPFVLLSSHLPNLLHNSSMSTTQKCHTEQHISWRQPSFINREPRNDPDGGDLRALWCTPGSCVQWWSKA